MYDLCIIGGGAGGLFAAIASARLGFRVCLVEANDRVGKKLLATGNGRCNLSNAGVSVQAYNTDFVAPVLARFSADVCRARFLKLGLLTVQDTDGRIYPYSNQANSVVNILRFRVHEANVRIEENNFVTAVEKSETGFLIVGSRSVIQARNVLLATGGKAGSGDGAAALYAPFGHRIKEETPSLCPLATEQGALRGLQGIRAQAEVTLRIKGEKIAAERGEVQFKQDAVSGIVMFNMSARLARENVKEGFLTIDFCPDLTTEELNALMEDPLTRAYGILPKLLAERCDTAQKVKNFGIKVRLISDFKQAQATVGGLKTEDFDPLTLESRLQAGLYACGEALDVDGLCGGFNLHWAWASGDAAAIAAARAFKNGEKHVL